MTKETLEALMKDIEHQEHSSILGGMQKDYEELEQMGLIRINWNEEILTAVITPEGRNFVASLYK